MARQADGCGRQTYRFKDRFVEVFLNELNLPSAPLQPRRPGRASTMAGNDRASFGAPVHRAWFERCASFTARSACVWWSPTR